MLLPMKRVPQVNMKVFCKNLWVAVLHIIAGPEACAGEIIIIVNHS